MNSETFCICAELINGDATVSRLCKIWSRNALTASDMSEFVAIMRIKRVSFPVASEFISVCGRFYRSKNQTFKAPVLAVDESSGYTFKVS